MVYNLVINAIRQALQLKSLRQFSDKELSELLHTVEFLQSVELSKKNAKYVREITAQVSDEIDRRCYPDVMIIIFGRVSELKEVIRKMTLKEKSELIDKVIELEEKLTGKSVSDERRDEIREYIESL